MISSHRFSKEYLNLDFLIAKTELEVKRIIQASFFKGESKNKAIERANLVVGRLVNQISNKQLKEDIIRSFKLSIHRWTQKFFVRDIALFAAVVAVVLKTTKNKKIAKMAAQKKLTEEVVVEEISSHQMDYFHHGFPYVEEYFKKLKKRTIELADASTYEADENGQVRKASLFAKAERELRYESNVQMINDMIKEGHRYCWISAHSDCSKRCEPWQGKLVDLIAPSVNSRFETGERIDGNIVYSLKDITNQVDKYGYKNNIIVGFNCRHYLIPYTPRSTPPFDKYGEGEIAKDRKINKKMRYQERRIRNLRERIDLLNVIDPNEAKKLHRKALALEREYIAFAKRNHFAYYPQRIRISSW